MTSTTRIHSRILKLLHFKHRHGSLSWSIPSPQEFSTTSALEVAPQPEPLGFHGRPTATSTGNIQRVDCGDNSSVSCSARTSRDNERRLHDVRLLEKMRMTFVDELHLLNIHGLQRCLQNDWNVNNLVHFATDESESESQSRNCSLSELDCRNLLLDLQTVSRLSSLRLSLRELVSARS